MKKLLVAGICAISFSCAQPALAQTITPNWSGFYLGGNLGYGWGKTTATDTGDGLGNYWTILGGQFSTSAQGFVGGLQAGYNVQTGSFVFGVESDFGILSGKGYDAWSGQNASALMKNSYYATFRGRLGVTSGPALFYFTGGAILAETGARVEADLINSLGYTNALGARWGWTVGAGLEWALGPQWSLKGEYLFYDLGVEQTLISACLAGCDFSLRNTGTLLRLGINYRFGN